MRGPATCCVWRGDAARLQRTRTRATYCVVKRTTSNTPAPCRRGEKQDRHASGEGVAFSLLSRKRSVGYERSGPTPLLREGVGLNRCIIRALVW
jgi:hypothetical protein